MESIAKAIGTIEDEVFVPIYVEGQRRIRDGHNFTGSREPFTSLCDVFMGGAIRLTFHSNNFLLP